MKKEDKKVIRDILQGKDLEMNLPAYAGSYISSTYEYSLIHLVLNYYTIKEIEDETNGVSKDEYLSGVVNELHTILFQTILNDDLREDYSVLIEKLHDLRNDMTDKMTVLTAYTDALQIYEYVLNRIEYNVTGESFAVEETELAAKVFQYLFSDNDKMVVNSKIQMVTGQLPIRMTKNRFFDYLTNTLNIYNGSDKSAVDDFVDMLKSTTLLEIPQGFETAYPAIYSFVSLLQSMDYKMIDLESYQETMAQFAVTTDYLTELVSNYLLVMEIVNDLYAALLALPYQKNEAKEVAVCVNMLKGLHDAFISEGSIPDEVDEGLEQIVGVQEDLGEEIMRFESVLAEITKEHADTIMWIMSDKIFNSLIRISKLSSDSLFVDLDKDEVSDDVADMEYVTAKRDELISILSEFFGNHSKEVNRAVMAAMFSSMPVLFNSQQEVKDYIEYSLNHCSNAGELMACAKILEDMMDEE
ncbi:MAG: hypothetical protein IJP29_07500 [Lachnospiraceae bacterium]|nr:hypothetical protein [Lachnospiraceae bacterium]